MKNLHEIPKLPSKWYYGLREDCSDKYIAQDKKKPCYLGDYVHLNNRNGTFYVIDVDWWSFTTQTKNGEPVKREWKHFKCLAGGHWNKVKGR
jgi:hypothetical protein